ncbi:MAG: KH domain-containing protein [Candidatus Aenigmarchaeota archaeon]|nr:KH domain-containing protein [Candidatus Aenigmarchaeota archaeon]
MAEKDQEFVEYVVKNIVDNPDKVSVKRSVDEMGVLLELTVDPSDMGKIIGKEGKTAKSLRTLLRVLGAKNDARINLKVIEPEGGAASKPKEVKEEKEVKSSKTTGETKEETKDKEVEELADLEI